MTNQELQDALAKLPGDLPVRIFQEQYGYWEDVHVGAEVQEQDEEDDKPGAEFVGIY